MVYILWVAAGVLLAGGGLGVEGKQARKFDGRVQAKVLIPEGHPYLIPKAHRHAYYCPDMRKGSLRDGLNLSAPVPGRSKCPPVLSGCDHSSPLGPYTNITTFNSFVDAIGRQVRGKGGFDTWNVMFVIFAFRVFLAETAPHPWPTDRDRRPVLLDIGGNVGIYSACAMWNGISSIAIEANPAVAHILQANTDFILSQLPLDDYSASGQQMIFRTAVNFEEGDPLCFHQSDRNLGASQIITNPEESGRKCSFFVPITTPQNIWETATKSQLWSLERFSRLFYLKIDIERMEDAALQGARELLSGPSRPCMGQFELMVKNTITEYPAVERMRKHGYCMASLERNVAIAKIRGLNQLYQRILKTKTCTKYPQPSIVTAKMKQVDVLFFLPGEEMKDCVARVSKGMGTR